MAEHRMKQRACLFAQTFKYWFDEEGRGLPFGRSLTWFRHRNGE
ncbi:hypothetical protein EA97_00906 [Enterococcus faecium]|nr:hypothetical protein EA97_00906 [Enterococcus faecium]